MLPILTILLHFAAKLQLFKRKEKREKKKDCFVCVYEALKLMNLAYICRLIHYL